MSPALRAPCQATREPEIDPLNAAQARLTRLRWGRFSLFEFLLSDARQTTEIYGDDITAPGRSPDLIVFSGA